MNEGLIQEIENCYRDIDELTQEKRDLEKLVFELQRENEQLKKDYQELVDATHI